MRVNREVTGFGFAVLDMVTYGLLPVFSHYFVTRMDPLFFSGIVTVLGSLPLFGRLKLKKKNLEIGPSPFLKPLLIIGVLNAFATLFYFEGTKLTSGLNTGLLIQIEPFFSIVLAAIFLGEVLMMNQLLATVLMVVGAVVIIYNKTSPFNLGDMMILSVPIFSQVSHIFAKRIINKVSDVSVIPATRLLYSGVILLILAVVVNLSSFGALLSPQNIISIILFAFIFRTLDQFFWYLALERIPLARASAVLPLAVAISFVGSVLILKEVPLPKHYFGMLLIFGGLLWLAVMQFRANRVKPEADIAP